MIWLYQFPYRMYIMYFPGPLLTVVIYRSGSYPTVTSHSGEWSLNPSRHSLDWTPPIVSAEDRSGNLEFTVGGDDAGAFFPVQVTFVGQGSVAGIIPATVSKVDNGEELSFSVDSLVNTDSYVVV